MLFDSALNESSRKEMKNLFPNVNIDIATNNRVKIHSFLTSKKLLRTQESGNICNIQVLVLVLVLGSIRY